MNDPIRKGAWIVSTKKHLDRHQYGPELSEFGATEIAGKAANLLALLQADAKETVSVQALSGYFVSAKIRHGERDEILRKLEDDERVEVRRTASGKLEGVDIYAFSREEVLQSAARIFDASDPTVQDRANIDALEFVCQLPRVKSEVVDHLAGEGFGDEEAEVTVAAQQSLKLIGVDKHPSLKEPILFNEHAFLENPSRIVHALKDLKPKDRQMVLDVQHFVEQKGCVPVEVLERAFPVAFLRMMERVGLLDRQEVLSAFGNVTFITLPQTFAGVYTGKAALGVDVFHHAKMLLSCVTYGAVVSVPGRGRIIDPVWIINALLRGNWVGPCEAIGQDYQILEKEGVIRLRRDTGEQYQMRLRKRQVGELAKQVLLYKRTLGDTGEVAKPPPNPGADYINPQDKRAMVAEPVAVVAEIQAALLRKVRT